MRKLISGCVFLTGVSLTCAQAQAQSDESIISEYADLLVLADLCPMLTFKATDGQFPQFFTAKKFNQNLIKEHQPLFDDFKRADKAAFEKRMLKSGKANCQDALEKYGEHGDSVPGLITAGNYSFDKMSNKSMHDAVIDVLNVSVAGDICDDFDVIGEDGLVVNWLKDNPYVFAIGERDYSYGLLHGSRVEKIFEKRKTLPTDENCKDARSILKLN
ncbi:hypothetical protein ACLBWZ_03355 [Brucellaceae bacterium C25G]